MMPTTDSQQKYTKQPCFCWLSTLGCTTYQSHETDSYW